MHQALAYPKTEEFKIPCYGGFNIKGLDLSEEALDKICSGNYDRWVGKPKPVNDALWMETAERVMEDLKGTQWESDTEFLRQLMGKM